MRWAQLQRLRFIGQHVLEHGRINLADIMGQFDVSRPQASTDLKVYMHEQPGVIAYDTSAKAYVRAPKRAA